MPKDIIAPLVTALIGLIGGLLLARYQSNLAAKAARAKAAEDLKSVRVKAEGDLKASQAKDSHDDQRALTELALEIVKLEFERARAEGRTSSHPILSHWAVVKALMQEQKVDLRDPQFRELINDLSSKYVGFCWDYVYPKEPNKELHPDGKADTRQVLSAALRCLKTEGPVCAVDSPITKTQDS